MQQQTNSKLTPPTVIRMRTGSTQENLDAWDQLPPGIRRFIAENAPVDMDAVEMLEHWLVLKAEGFTVAQVVAIARKNLDNMKGRLALFDYGPTHPQAIAQPEK